MFKIDVIDDKNLKITYLGDKKIETITYCLNPWDIITDECFKHTFTGKGHWVVYNIDLINKSRLIIKTDNLNHEFVLPTFKKIDLKTKIICNGLNKTGTTSLSEGLRRLGLKQFPENIGHQFLSDSIINESYGKLIDSIENPKYDFYEDIPFSFPNIYKKIFNFFPNEKYILTVRNNTNEWVNSCINFYGKYLYKFDLNDFSNIGSYNHMYSNVGNYKTYNWIHPMFKSWRVNGNQDIIKQLTEIYEKHNNNFIDFMEKNSADYIVINVSKKGELKKLSEWIGIETLEQDFKHINKTKK